MSSTRLSTIILIVISVLLLSLAGMGCSPKFTHGERSVPSYKELTYSRLGDIRIPDVKRVTLANGMQLFLLEDHELPLINMSALTSLLIK